MAYSVFLRPAAIRDLKALAFIVRKRIEEAIERLAEEPRPHGSKKLVGLKMNGGDEWETTAFFMSLTIQLNASPSRAWRTAVKFTDDGSHWPGHMPPRKSGHATEPQAPDRA